LIKRQVSRSWEYLSNFLSNSRLSLQNWLCLSWYIFFIRLDTHFLIEYGSQDFLNVLWISKKKFWESPCMSPECIFECAENLISSKCIWHFSYRLKDYITQNLLMFILPFSCKIPYSYIYLLFLFPGEVKYILVYKYH